MCIPLRARLFSTSPANNGSGVNMEQGGGRLGRGNANRTAYYPPGTFAHGPKIGSRDSSPTPDSKGETIHQPECDHPPG